MCFTSPLSPIPTFIGIRLQWVIGMSKQTELTTTVEAALNQLSNIEDVDLQSVEFTEEGIDMTLSISSAVEGSEEDDDEAASDPSNSSAVEGGQDETGFVFDNADSTQSNSSAVEGWSEVEDYNLLQKTASEELESYPEDSSTGSLQEKLAEAEVPLPSNSSAVEEGEDEESEDDENDTSPSNSSAVEEGEVTDEFLLDNGVKKRNLEGVKKYRAKNGVCSQQSCEHGANDDSEFCASHQNSSASKKGSTEEKSYEDLTESQKSRVEYLISNEDKSLEEAVQMA